MISYLLLVSTLRSAALNVFAGIWVAAHSDNGDGMDRFIELTVSAAVEPVSDS
ncbi:MAG: hypothetical protein L0G87_06860 [Renibacterium salmoninarum]|jgi:hypothetical protein|uniref:Uncharacterized protein n=1 Tax=Arthrobacter russicus TaxID=172040 RepID=A0ABU1JCH4_9MICC|nr:hypothetical protein [Arthrobacter russicus]MDN5668102.1 hypothetical protein [Renibacterium salmoninarum]MDR6270131.1 hypothetical protein [Arthrobacter russicus]